MIGAVGQVDIGGIGQMREKEIALVVEAGKKTKTPIVGARARIYKNDSLSLEMIDMAGDNGGVITQKRNGRYEMIASKDGYKTEQIDVVIGGTRDTKEVAKLGREGK